jgi:transcriptional regulator with XRE-family HTH domain
MKIPNKAEFGERLAKLRIAKGVSAREMSLAIGQHHGYISSIENGINYPAMQGFFYICEYLDITPQEFFDFDTASPKKLSKLSEKMKHLKTEQLALIESMVDNMK